MRPMPLSGLPLIVAPQAMCGGLGRVAQITGSVLHCRGAMRPFLGGMGQGAAPCSAAPPCGSGQDVPHTDRSCCRIGCPDSVSAAPVLHCFVRGRLPGLVQASTGVQVRSLFARVSVRCRHDVFPGRPYPATDPRLIIQDLGIHVFDITRALFREVEGLSARIDPASSRGDMVAILMDHAGGVTRVMDCSCATWREENFPRTLIEIDGTQDTLRLEPGHQQMRAGLPPLLFWADRPWHNILIAVALI